MYFWKYGLLEGLSLSLCESGEDPVTHTVVIISSDPDLDPSNLIRPEFRCDISEPILSAMTSLLAESDFSELHIDIVGEDEEIL